MKDRNKPTYLTLPCIPPLIHITLNIININLKNKNTIQIENATLCDELFNTIAAQC